MEIKIPHHIIKKATKCSKNFRCLSADNDNLCRAICYMNKDMFFVKCMDGEDCSYFEPHEKTQLCKCPVRQEIYRRYNM